MSKRLSVWCLVLACCLGLKIGLRAIPAQASPSIDVSFFYDRLAPYGHWVNHVQYGWVWYPVGVSIGWRPYTAGHWAWTDTYGWLWVSDWEWGWAPFHYGRWAFDDGYGWIWVPGTVWGPAWVSWRTGGGYIGWAPLPPGVGWEAGGRLSVERGELDIAIGRPSWVFVAARSFLAPRVQQIIVPPARNVTVIPVTKNVTNYVTVNNRIVDRSISVQQLEHMHGVHVPRMRVKEALSVAEAQMAPGRPDTVTIFHPAVQPVAPVVKPPAPNELERRHTIEHEMLHERHQAQQALLEQQAPAAAQASVAAPTPPAAHPSVSQEAASPQQKQWKAEQQALRTQQQREQALLRNRQEQDRAFAVPSSGTGPPSGAPQSPESLPGPQQASRPRQGPPQRLGYLQHPHPAQEDKRPQQ